METPSAIPTIPRLRVSRQPQSTVYDYSASTNYPEAGPSRLSSSSLLDSHNFRGDNLDDDEQQDTPKLTVLPDLPEDTPAARLKAVLERTSAKSKPPPAPLVSSASVSEFESDSEIPTIGFSQPSIARETLNSLFSHALREPGDTPQKIAKGKMRRRNSIDTSDFEGSPRTVEVIKDRSDNKGKRKSMSDDELSMNRSQAAIFDTLRQRLDSSSQKSQADPDESFDVSKDLGTPPAATSTPQHSLKLSFNSQFQSNLLDQDSEMQRAIKDLVSYEHSLPADSSSILDSSKAVTYGSTEKDSHSRVMDPSPSDRQQPRLTPSRVGRSHRERSRSREPVADELHDHQREWNKNPPKAPEQDRNAYREHNWNRPRYSSTTRPLSISALQGPTPHSPSDRARTSSFTSRPSSRLSTLSRRPSQDHSRPSSRASSSTGSILSQKSEEGTGKTIKAELDHERERNWNAPRPSWHQHPSMHQHNRSSSSLDMHSPSAEHVRTLSFPSRPDSRLSISSPLPSRKRHDSHDSSRSSSRTSSRAGSARGSLGSLESDEERLHEQERNWNSPRPHWSSHSRSDSAGYSHSYSHTPSNQLQRTQSFTQKSTPSPTSSISSAHFSMDTSATARRRAESLKSTKFPSLHSASPVHQKDFPKSRSLSSSKHSGLVRPDGYPIRPSSPLPPIGNGSASRLFPSRNTPSPEPTKSLSLLRHLSSPSLSPSSRLHDSGGRPSHIPVRSRTRPTGTVLFPESVKSSSTTKAHHEHEPSDKPISQEVENDIKDEKLIESDSTDTDTEADQDNQLAQESTPTLRPNAVLPPPETPAQSEPSSVYTSFLSEAKLEKIIASPPSPPLSSPSDGPPTPAAESFFPSTPPRKDSFSSSKLEFQTPSPPKNLPDLPGPPSSLPSSDNEDPTPKSANLTSLKTPKPPGAWSTTPVPPRTNPFIRSNSLPTDDEHDSIDSGLVTPAASLSRAATMPPQTPALPGGWLNTPANRKSVRFYEEPSLSSEQSNLESVVPKVEEVTDAAAVSSETPRSPSSSKAEPSPSKSSPIPSPSHARDPRKAPIIRMVNAYGREEKKKKDDASGNGSSRFEDTKGHAVENSFDSIPFMPEGSAPTRSEALERVRGGLQELRKELINEEGHNVSSGGVRDRVRNLEKTSKEARESRKRLASEMLMNAENITKKLAPLRASMQRSASFIPSTSNRQSARRAWLIWLSLQIFVLFLIYRAAKSYAKNTFLTTYYDPLYPDLFFYTSLPTNYCSSSSVLEVFRRDGFKVAALQALDYVTIAFSSGQLPCQPLHDNIGPNPTWPPT